jgi:hypothetical protein
MVITANRLSDGVVVFLGPHARWVEHLRDAAVLASDESEAALAQAQQDEARQVVVGPYVVEVVRSGTTVAPKALREAIRAAGPTVRPDLAKASGPKSSGATSSGPKSSSTVSDD